MIIGGENNIVETVKYLLTGIVDIEKPEFVLLKLFSNCYFKKLCMKQNWAVNFIGIYFDLEIANAIQFNLIW